MDLKPPISISFIKKNTVKSPRNENPDCLYFKKDAVHTVPQMLVSVSGGYQVISSHQSYCRQEKNSDII